MILCVNLNAAIDKTVIVPSFQLGQIHRPELVKALPGGKGCNVARALQELGEEAVVTGWVGGTAGQFIEQGLREEGIGTAFVGTPCESRTCLSILDSENQVLTEIYEKGDPVPAAQVEEMLARFRELVGAAAAVTLSGSLPPGIPFDFYARLIAIAHEAGVPAYLDSSKAALRQGVQARPFLVKPNEMEVAVLAGSELSTQAEFARAAAEISRRYDTIVVLSRGAEGALAAQGDELLMAQSPPVTAESAVGSGDSMLAGLAAAFSHGLPLSEALTFGVAAGTANTLVVGAGQFARRDFEEIRSRVVVRPL